MSFRALAGSIVGLIVVGLGVIFAFVFGATWAPSAGVVLILLSVMLPVVNHAEWERKYEQRVDSLIDERVKASEQLRLAALYLDEALMKMFLIIEPSHAEKPFYAGSIQFIEWRNAFVRRCGGTYGVVRSFVDEKIPGCDELPPSTTKEQLDDILAPWKGRLNG